MRTRASQQEADHDLDQFSLFFQDKPDGVVKMRSCKGGDTTSPSGNTGNPPKVLDISGAWRGSGGSIYSFSQNGSTFAWTRADTDEVGTGTIDGTAVSASYKSSSGYGSSSGTITLGLDDKPARISWSNGDYYTR